MTSRRWDADEIGHGGRDARAALPAIEQLALLAGEANWVAEDPEAHLLPGLRRRAETSGLSVDAVDVDSGGTLRVRLSFATKLSRREIRESVWSMLGGVAELTSLVTESQSADSITFDVVTGIPPGDGHFATHGHTIRLEVVQPD